MVAPSEADAASAQRRIIHVARQYLGVPYRRMNCSEYTALVYRRALGVYLPADDDAQRFYGYEVPFWRRGDLLYYREHGGAGRVTHVAIYYGGGRIIHSSNYFDKVTISQERYIHGYLYAHRIRP